MALGSFLSSMSEKLSENLKVVDTCQTSLLSRQWIAVISSQGSRMLSKIFSRQWIAVKEVLKAVDNCQNFLRQRIPDTAKGVLKATNSSQKLSKQYTAVKKCQGNDGCQKCSRQWIPVKKLVLKTVDSCQKFSKQWIDV